MSIENQKLKTLTHWHPFIDVEGKNMSETKLTSKNHILQVLKLFTEVKT